MILNERHMNSHLAVLSPIKGSSAHLDCYWFYLVCVFLKLAFGVCNYSAIKKYIFTNIHKGHKHYNFWKSHHWIKFVFLWLAHFTIIRWHRSHWITIHECVVQIFWYFCHFAKLFTFTFIFLQRCDVFECSFKTVSWCEGISWEHKQNSKKKIPMILKIDPFLKFYKFSFMCPTNKCGKMSGNAWLCTQFLLLYETFLLLLLFHSFPLASFSFYILQVVFARCPLIGNNIFTCV